MPSGPSHPGNDPGASRSPVPEIDRDQDPASRPLGRAGWDPPGAQLVGRLGDCPQWVSDDSASGRMPALCDMFGNTPLDLYGDYFRSRPPDASPAIAKRCHSGCNRLGQAPDQCARDGYATDCGPYAVLIGNRGSRDIPESRKDPLYCSPHWHICFRPDCGSSLARCCRNEIRKCCCLVADGSEDRAGAWSARSATNNYLCPGIRQVPTYVAVRKP
jgi:hypothetical protein